MSERSLIEQLTQKVIAEAVGAGEININRGRRLMALEALCLSGRLEVGDVLKVDQILFERFAKVSIQRRPAKRIEPKLLNQGLRVRRLAKLYNQQALQKSLKHLNAGGEVHQQGGVKFDVFIEVHIVSPVSGDRDPITGCEGEGTRSGGNAGAGEGVQ